MPSFESYVWIVLFALIAIVGALALWKGGRFKVGGGKSGFSFEARAGRRGATGRPGVRGDVSVAKGADFREAEVGEIVGRQGGRRPAGRIEVASAMKVRKGKIGSIVGQQDDGPKNDEP